MNYYSEEVNQMISEINADNFVKFLRVKDSNTRKSRLEIIVHQIKLKIKNKEHFTDSQLSTFVRMNKQVPFSKIRKAFGEILDLLRVKKNFFFFFNFLGDKKNLLLFFFG